MTQSNASSSSVSSNPSSSSVSSNPSGSDDDMKSILHEFLELGKGFKDSVDRFDGTLQRVEIKLADLGDALKRSSRTENLVGQVLLRTSHRRLPQTPTMSSPLSGGSEVLAQPPEISRRFPPSISQKGGNPSNVMSMTADDSSHISSSDPSSTNGVTSSALLSNLEEDTSSRFDSRTVGSTTTKSIETLLDEEQLMRELMDCYQSTPVLSRSTTRPSGSFAGSAPVPTPTLHGMTNSSGYSSSTSSSTSNSTSSSGVAKANADTGVSINTDGSKNGGTNAGNEVVTGESIGNAE